MKRKPTIFQKEETEIKKEDNPYKSMIPESIRKAYGHLIL